jgi:hypothetical protein
MFTTGHVFTVTHEQEALPIGGLLTIRNPLASFPPLGNAPHAWLLSTPAGAPRRQASDSPNTVTPSNLPRHSLTKVFFLLFPNNDI